MVRAAKWAGAQQRSETEISGRCVAKSKKGFYNQVREKKMWWSEARRNPGSQVLVIYMLPGEDNPMILEREEGKRGHLSVCGGVPGRYSTQKEIQRIDETGNTPVGTSYWG